jgi:hypothetical protein
MVQSKVSPFTFKNIVICDIVDPYQIFVEYESEAVIKATGRLYIENTPAEWLLMNTERSN